MKKIIIIFAIVFMMSCATTSINLFSTINELTVKEYTELSFSNQMLICEGFLIGVSRFNPNTYTFMCCPFSAHDLHIELNGLTREYKEDYAVNVMFLALFNLTEKLKENT